MLIIILYTLLARLLLLCLMVILFIPTLYLIALKPERRRRSNVCNWIVYGTYKALNAITLVPIRVRGKEHIPQEPAIIIANHQSSLDIPLIGALLGPHPHIWLATHELMDSPILRFILPKFAVLIDMTSPSKGRRSLVNAINAVCDEPLHTLIFPEGSRYDDGEIHDFYGGFGILAKKTGRPVVPVRIFNAHKVYPKGTFWAFWSPIQLVVGPSMTQDAQESDESFKERVRSWFLAQHEV